MFSGATADGLVCSANTADGPAFKRGRGCGVEVCGEEVRRGGNIERVRAGKIN